MANRVIRQSPGIYINEPGILKSIEGILADLEIQYPVIVTDELVKKVTADFLPAHFYETYPLFLFAGANTFAEVSRLVDLISQFQVDGLIALGGGQLMDNAKLVADQLKVKLINIQTVPSNCAALTTKSIVYNHAHEMIESVRIANPIAAVLIEPRLLKESPRPYLNSGIGDTLAKFYEIRRRLPKDRLSLATEKAARFFLDECRDEIIAVKGVDQLESEQLINFLDTVFLFAAAVDGFADSNGRSVAAHTFYNAFMKVKGVTKFTHGEIVALGNLIQVELEANQGLISEIHSYYPHFGLPEKLSDLAISDREAREIAIQMTDVQNERMQSIFPAISAEQILAVFERL